MLPYSPSSNSRPQGHTSTYPACPSDQPLYTYLCAIAYFLPMVIIKSSLVCEWSPVVLAQEQDPPLSLRDVLKSFLEQGYTGWEHISRWDRSFAQINSMDR